VGKIQKPNSGGYPNDRGALDVFLGAKGVFEHI
jgi:hypothetical protein